MESCEGGEGGEDSTVCTAIFRAPRSDSKEYYGIIFNYSYKLTLFRSVHTQQWWYRYMYEYDKLSAFRLGFTVFASSK